MAKKLKSNPKIVLNIYTELFLFQIGQKVGYDSY